MLGLTLFICSGIDYLACSVLSATSPTGGHDTFSLSFRFASLVFFVFSVSYVVYAVPAVSSTIDMWRCIVDSAYLVLHNSDVASLWRSFVTTELASLCPRM